MWGVLLAMGAVAGIVKIAVNRARAPMKGEAWMKWRLGMLAKKPVTRLKLDEAEDGLVLARRLGQKVLERRFGMVVTALRKRRPLV